MIDDKTIKVESEPLPYSVTDHLREIQARVKNNEYSERLTAEFDTVLDILLAQYPNLKAKIDALRLDFNYLTLSALCFELQSIFIFMERSEGFHYKLLKDYDTTIHQLAQFLEFKDANKLTSLDCKFPSFILERIIQRFLTDYSVLFADLQEIREAEHIEKLAKHGLTLEDNTHFMTGHVSIILSTPDNNNFRIEFNGNAPSITELDAARLEALNLGFNALGNDIPIAALKLDLTYKLYENLGTISNNLDSENPEIAEAKMAEVLGLLDTVLDDISKIYPDFELKQV